MGTPACLSAQGEGIENVSTIRRRFRRCVHVTLRIICDNLGVHSGSEFDQIPNFLVAASSASSDWQQVKLFSRDHDTLRLGLKNLTLRIAFISPVGSVSRLLLKSSRELQVGEAT